MAREQVGGAPLRPDDSATVSWVQGQLRSATASVPTVEILTDVDGTTHIFTTQYSFIPGSTNVYRNGLREHLGLGYTEASSDQLVFSSAPLNDDELVVSYLRSS